MNNDDEVLVAWLKSREYKIETIEGRLWLSQLGWANTRSVNAEDLGKWASPLDQGPALYVELSPEQRGKWRPLRELVREWVIGL